MRAFTLIELLIVVAIIAILAAIAVPNFLEAQTRSKVARVKSDMRTMATAIESYSVDYTRVPRGEYEIQFTAAGGSDKYSGTTMSERAMICQRRLTTPVAYLTSLPDDPFMLNSKLQSGITHTSDLYIYHSHTWDGGILSISKNAGYTWSLHSYGPARENAQSGHVGRVLTGLGWANELVPYDSTNGTISYGQIYRTNKGEFNQPFG